jgi:hypothetical protein
MQDNVWGKTEQILEGDMEHWARAVMEDAVFETEGPVDSTLQDFNRILNWIEASDVHLFRTERIEELADTLSSCSDLEELSRVMWHIATEVGFENYIIFVINSGAYGAAKSRVCTSCNAEWISRYQEKNYQYVDPAMAHARRFDGYFELSQLPSDSPMAEEFWRDAEAHRIGRNGLCFVVRRNGNSRIGVSFLTAKTAEQTHTLARRNGYDLMTLANLAVDAFCYAVFGGDGATNNEELTVEELRFLHMLATSRDPLEALKMPTRYGSINALQASIRRKLRSESVFQAVAIASSRGAFDDLPYDASEVTGPFRELSGLEPDIRTHYQLSEPGSDD